MTAAFPRPRVPSERKPTLRPSLLDATMADRNTDAKLRIYHTIYRLNLSFANIVVHCRALQESGILGPKDTGSTSPLHKSCRRKSIRTY